MRFTSHARNVEDVLVHRVFAGVAEGFYVDVGADDPNEASITKAFCDRGWHGINLAPGGMFDRLAAARPRDINLPMTVLDHDGMAGVLAKHAPERRIDFLRIDAPRAEAAMIGGTDWRAIRPSVLAIEAGHLAANEPAAADWEKALLAGGYRRVWFDGITCVYVPEERDRLRHLFAVPIESLDGSARVDPGGARSDAARHSRDAQLASLRRRLELTQGELSIEREARMSLEARLATTPGAPAAATAPPSPGTTRRLARRAGFAAYRLVRPMIRPLLWRLRGFLIAGLTDELRQLPAQIEAGFQRRDEAGAVEMRRLAMKIEHAIITLAIERAADP